MEKSSKRRRNLSATGALALVAVIGGIAYAQDFRTFAGTNERAGRSTPQATTIDPETVWGNAGRGFLRWWDPIFELGQEIDNDEVGTSVQLGAFINPVAGGPDFSLAGGYLQDTIGTPPYRYAVTSPTGGNAGADPSLGATAIYQWQFTGLGSAQEYAVEVNLPVGSTDIDPSLADDFRFTPAFQLYSVTNETETQFFWVNMRTQGGSFARLGDSSTPPFLSVAVPSPGNPLGSLTVRLYNVCRRNDFGTLIDPTDLPGQDIVYADTVKVVGQGATSGTYVASPVVGQLIQPRLDGNPTVFNQRVVSARNETVFAGGLNKEVRFGSLTSFTHNGAVVDPAEPLRRNMVWSWPALRPNDLSEAERDRYAVDREAWITGGVNAAYPRNLVFRQADNLSAGTSIGAGFVDGFALSRIGPSYASIPATVGPTSFVEWEPVADPGFYFIEVYLPNDDAPGALARTVNYQILQGGTVVATRTIDQSAGNNWLRLPNQPDGFEHSAALPLTVRVLSQGSADDVTNNREVHADAIRFVGDADLGITATPVQTVATVNAPGATTVDLVLVARENGTLTAMEAHGDEVVGDQNNVFWTWPSEDPDTDPNAVAAEDGGIAELPTGFNLSSPLVANVGGADLAYIGAKNNRVYALEMAGRGDGTTRRRWTWPTDYDPTAPSSPMSPTNISGVVGSVALANVGGTPAIIVATTNGRIFALDAAGNAATRSTNILWQYPAAGDPQIGEMTSSPIVAFGRVYVASDDIDGAGLQGMVALDEDTGLLDWSRATRADNLTQMGRITGSPVAVEAPILAADTVFYVDGGGFITSVNAATGAVNWEENSVSSSTLGGLRFAYMRTYNPAGTFIDNEVPTVLVSSTQGALLGYYADGSLNINGNRRNWGYFVEGGGPQVASLAVGGWPNAAGLFANRTHIYAADSDGILYAFSSEDDANLVPAITPGIAPGSQSANPNDPDQSELNGMIEQDDVVVLSPADYETLEQLAQAGTLTYADLTNFQTNAIQRRAYEYGETLYVMVKDIHATTVTTTPGYYIQFGLGAETTQSRPLVLPVRNVTGAPTPQEGGVAFTKVPLRPSGGLFVSPGPILVEVSARAGGRNGLRGDPQSLATSVNTPLGASFSLAHPFGVEFRDAFGVVQNGAGVTTNPADPLVTGNRPVGYTGGLNAPFDKWTNAFADPGLALGVPGGRFSSVVNGSDPVSHNSVGISSMRVVDRTLMFLQDKPTNGVQGVRMQTNDLVWQPTSLGIPANATDAGVAKPLGAAYAGFEDFPRSFPNISLDYPDMNRGGLSITRSVGADTANPLFNQIGLLPPSFTVTDAANYQTAAGYEAGFNRTLTPTVFGMRMAVPEYQPATLLNANRPFGYVGTNLIYVDSGSPGLDSTDAARTFTMATNVAVDERISTSTRTVDLGSIPGGGGYYNPFTGVAQYPGVANGFAPFNPGFLNPNAPQFQTVTGFNEGNVNLLNVRVSRRLAVRTGFNQVERPLELFAPAEHELAWFDAANSLFSDLDPFLSPTNRAGIDPNGAVALQKPRPGDPAPTRLSTNPRRRQNSNLNVTSGSLIADQVAFPVGDPQVGVAVPLGAPVGSYVRDIFLFEDTIAGSADYGVNFPTLGYQVGASGLVPESFTDPAITLKFNVRETRVTNRSTTKTESIFENVPVADAGFDWSNRQPTVAMGDQAQTYFAFSSNRLGVGGPSIFARGKLAADGVNPNAWRIYFGGNRTNPVPFGPSQSPLNLSLLTAVPTATGTPGETWMSAGESLPNGLEWNNWFAVGAGETLTAPANENSARFLYPTFSGHGLINPLDPATPTRATQTRRFMAFVGETTKRDRSGNVVPLSQLMVADLEFGAAGTVRQTSGANNGVFPLETDATSKKGKPSIVQQGTNVATFYPAQSSGRTELYSAVFDGSGLTWGGVQSLGVGAIFEEVSGVAANLRRVPAAVSTSGVAIDMFFTGKVRGRQNSEAYHGQMAVDANGMPVANQEWTIVEDRFDRLEYDATTGMYWAPGVHWAMGRFDVNSFGLVLIDPRTGVVTNLINNDTLNPAHMRSRIIDRENREMIFESPRGGKVYIDARRGSVRLSGAVLGRNSQLYIAYSPRFVRVSGTSTTFRTGSGLVATANASAGLNYRGTSVVFDDRLLGIYQEPGAPWRNLSEDFNFWLNASTGAVAGTTEIQHDRFFAAFGRTSNDGSTTARPVMSTMRFGVQLPVPVATTANGTAVNLSITGLSTNLVQVDPVGGKVYFPASEEGAFVTINYTGVDANGQALLGQSIQTRVRLVIERGEELIPIEQVGQEGDFTMTLDRVQTNNVSTQLRKPSMLWMMWSSTRAGAQDVYMQTMAPKTAPRIARP